MAYIKLNDILKKRGKSGVHINPAAVNGARIKVLIGNCSHCARLKDNVLSAARQLALPESDIEIVTDLARIVKLGVITTPALIVDGKLVSCGKTLTEEQLLPLLKRNEEK